ncbi:hypothetical protein J3F84DRAFT_208636 [Trichoderma pleuroticola]
MAVDPLMPAQIASSPDRGPCGRRLSHSADSAEARAARKRPCFSSVWPSCLMASRLRPPAVALEWVRRPGSSWDYVPSAAAIDAPKTETAHALCSASRPWMVARRLA